MTRYRSVTSCTVAVLALAHALANPAFAQSETSGSTATAEADFSTRLEDIVVTARKIGERAQDVPVSISAFSADQLETRGIDDLTSVGAITPGLSLTQGTGSSTQLNVSIRGNSEVDTQLALDPAVGVYVDNVYYARSINLGVGLFDLDRIEVLKGPQGTLFGRNTTGGALNITTADPGEKFEGYLNGTYGNYDKIRVQAAVSVPLGQDAGLRLATNINKRDGFVRNPLLGTDLEDENNQSYRAKFLWTPGDWEIRLNGDYSRVKQSPVASVATPIEACNPFAGVGVQAVFNPDCGTPANIAFITSLYGPGGLIATAAGFPGGLLVNGALPPSLTNIPGAINSLVPGTIAAVRTQNTATQNDPRTLFLNTQGVTAHKEYGGSLSVSHDFGAAKVKSIVAYRNIDARDYWDADGISLPLLDVDKDLDQEQLSLELQVTGTTLNDALSYAAGYFYFDESGTDIVDQDIGGTQSVTTLATDAKNRSHALYAQLNYKLPFLDGLSLTAGYRQSWDKRQVTVRHQALSQFAAAIPFCDLEPALIAVSGTPGICAATVSENFNGHSLVAGLDYRINANLLLYGSYKEGFRSGGFSGRAGSIAQLTPVLPETVFDLEAGIKSDWDVGNVAVRLNLSLFQTQIHNRQREFTRQTPTGGLTTIVESAARSTVRGFELEGAIVPIEYLNISFGLSHIDSFYKLFVDRLGVDRTNEPVPQSPRWNFSLGFVYSPPINAGGNASIAVDYTSLSSQSFGFNPDPTVTADGYGLLNARVGWENILDGAFSVHAFAKNLTDKEYVQGGVFLRSNFGYSINYFGAPRTYGIEAGFKF
jgi:iron complex outermembrane recepter protein